MNESIDTVLIVHASREWRTFHRRQMLLALAEVLPSHVALLCVNRPITLDVTPWKHPRKFWGRAETFQDARLHVLTPRLLLHDIVAAKIPGAPSANALLLRRVLQGHLRRHYPNIRRMIQWIYHPVQRWVFNVLPEAGRIYECYDEYSRTPDGRLVGSRQRKEQSLLRMADLTFVTAEALVPPRQQAARRLALITNGVPEFFFDAAHYEPNALVDIPRPRIGYLGNARPPFDIDLLEAVFRRRRDWHLMLAGPVDKSLRIRGLRALPNAHFLPSRPLEEVPALLRQWDVGLIPFQLNDFSRALNPLKLGEYLACGLPVVATDLPELRAQGDLVFRAPNEPAGFEEAIVRALAVDRTSYARRAVAAAHEITWTAIAQRYVLPELRAAFEF